MVSVKRFEHLRAAIEHEKHLLEARFAQIREALGDLSTIISEKPSMYRISDQQQQRLDYLMDRNNEGLLSAREEEELAELAGYAQRLSIENGKSLVAEKNHKLSAQSNRAHPKYVRSKRVHRRSKRRVSYA